MTKNKKNIEITEVASEGKKFVALQTISILAGSNKYNLTKGEEISFEISKELAESLINSKIIK